MSMFRPFYGGEKGGTKSQQDKHIVPTSSEERKLLLNQLKCRLSDTPHELKAAYAHAQRVNSKIVDDDHLLLFLEYDNFDVEAASKNLLRYWENRLSLWGESDFTKPITLRGAMRQYLDDVMGMYVQLLPVFTPDGSAIIHFDTRKNVSGDGTMVKLMVYILQRFMDKSSKYYGRSLAVLSNGSGVTLSNFSTGWISQVTRHYSSIPVTSNSIHLCHTEKVFPLVMGAIKVVLDAAQRDEFRLHDGNDQQVAESLCRFGFDLDCIPTSLGGKLELNEEDYMRGLAADESAELEDLIDTAPSKPLTLTGQTSPSVWSPLSAGGEESSGRQEQSIDMYAHQADILAQQSFAVAEAMYPAMQAVSASNVFNLMGSASPTISNIPTLAAPGGALPQTISQCLPLSLGQLASLQSIQRDQYSMTQQQHFQQQQFQHQLAPSWNHQIALNASSLATPSNVAVQSSPLHSVITKPQAQQKKTVKKKLSRSAKHPGRTGDQRMNKAVQAKLNDSDISLIDALLSGGFVFPDLDKEDKTTKTADVKDLEGISIYQRRNQLLRRLRLVKEKEKKSM